MASKIFCHNIVYSNENLKKGDTFAYPRQRYSLKGFPKGPRPFGRRRHIGPRLLSHDRPVIESGHGDETGGAAELVHEHQIQGQDRGEEAGV